MTTTVEADTTGVIAQQRKRRDKDREKNLEDRNTKRPLHVVFTNTERDVAFVRAKNPRQALSRHLGARTGQRKLRIRHGMIGDFGFNRKSGAPVLSEVIDYGFSARSGDGAYVTVRHLPTYWGDKRSDSNISVVRAMRAGFGPWWVYDNPGVGHGPTANVYGATALEAASQFLGCEPGQLIEPGSRTDDGWYLLDVAGNPKRQRFLLSRERNPDPRPTFDGMFWSSKDHREIEVTLNSQFTPGYYDGKYRASVFRDHPEVRPEPPDPDPPLAPKVMPLLEDAYAAATAAAKAEDQPEARAQARTAKRLLFDAMSLPQLKRRLK